MSFRELRNFCEIMRSLGYHRLISMENFRTPNFELVADVLDWLIHRFEPNASIPDDISDEHARVEFMRTVAEKVFLRTGIKLNTRKLYGADGYAVKELLKLATVLNDAQKSVGQVLPELPDDSFSLSSKLSDLKTTRSLCSQIVETGASLFDLMQKETNVRQEREKALRFLDGISRNLESNNEHEVIERAISSMLGSQGQNLEQLKQMTEELQKDEKNLETKIKKKRQELDRCRKRLSSLVSVRPAFMDEFEKLEAELERYYEQYVGRFRNLDYLEHELDVLNREDTERMEENDRALKKMQKRLREEEWRLLRGEDDESGPKDRKGGGKRPQGRGEGSEVFGGMDAGTDDEGSSRGSGSETDERISVGGSQEGSDDPAVSLGGSGSDDDILNESDEDLSEDDGMLVASSRSRGGGRSDHDF